MPCGDNGKKSAQKAENGPLGAFLFVGVRLLRFAVRLALRRFLSALSGLLYVCGDGGVALPLRLCGCESFLHPLRQAFGRDEGLDDGRELRVYLVHDLGELQDAGAAAVLFFGFGDDAEKHLHDD